MQMNIKLALILAGIAVLAMVGGAAYFSPDVQARLSWKIDEASTYLRMGFQPVPQMPTTLPRPRMQVTRHPLEVAVKDPAGNPAQATLTPTTGPTPTPTPSPTPLPGAMSLPAPLFEKQEPNACGPASLAMYLRFFGWKGTQTDISDVIKVHKEDRNVNVDELQYYVRTHAGWLNFEFRVGGDVKLLKTFLASGFPVMIEEGMTLDKAYWNNDDLWAAHYLLLTGYDDGQGTFTSQDTFYGANRPINYKTLDSNWQVFNRVYIVVYPTDQEERIKNILGSDWDKDLNRQHALEAAQAETQTQPKNPYTWFNVGSNQVYFDHYIEASEAYDVARNLGLPQRMLRYQFGPFIAYFNTGQMNDLMTLTDYALKITPNGEEILLWHGWVLYRKGDTAGAIADWQKALLERPGYADAEYALKFVGAMP